MNHLHEWLEQLSVNGAESPVIGLAKRSICFSMPDMSACPGVEQRTELLRLPYENCWIEGRGKTHEKSPKDDGVVGMLCHQKPDGFVALIYTRVSIPDYGRQKHWFKYDGIGWSQTDGWLHSNRTGTDDPTVNLTESYIRWLGSFLTLLNCANVSREEHPPSDQLQKARARRGKLPLYSYWTLNLNIDRSERREDMGGTHASPRLHLRRGHTRQHHSGQWCWVNPHAVGNKKLGIIHKDYAMRPVREPL